MRGLIVKTMELLLMADTLVYRTIRVAAVVLLVAMPAFAQFEFGTSSPVGDSGDTVRGIRIQSTGNIVMAADLSGGPFVNQPVRTAGAKGNGVVIILSPDGRKVRSTTMVGRTVRDLALDAHDNIYVACGPDGVAKLNPDATRQIWRQSVNGLADRLDASPGGYVVALRVDRFSDAKPGQGVIHLFDPRGRKIVDFKGHRDTLDVTVDEKSKTVIHVGWRQARANDPAGKNFPVQIAYVRGVGFDGEVKYTGYDWSTDTQSDRFLNKRTNNMADTRGYRCEVGRDGLLYVAFEAAGGNHIFRYAPVDLDQSVSMVGGDKYHEFHNSKSEHKTVFVRMHPGTGEFLAGQQFCTRLSNGSANAARIEHGAIVADAKGRVFLGGVAASGLPMSIMPPDSGEYTGGGFVLGLDEGLRRRLLCTRVQPGSHTHAVDARHVAGRLIVAFAGGAAEKPDQPMFMAHAVQENVGPGVGFVVVLGTADTPPPNYRPPVREQDAKGDQTQPARQSDRNQADAAEQARQAAERAARVRLVAAQRYMDAGKKQPAIEVLQALIETYPDTEAAVAGRELLKKAEAMEAESLF